MNTLTPAQQSFFEFCRSALIQLDEQERNAIMNKNIGITNGNWHGGQRPTLDDVPFELTPLQLLQVDLDVAHQFICQGTPAMIEIGQRRVREVVAEVWKIVEAETPSLYVPGLRVLSVMDGVK